MVRCSDSFDRAESTSVSDWNFIPFGCFSLFKNLLSRRCSTWSCYSSFERRLTPLRGSVMKGESRTRTPRAKANVTSTLLNRIQEHNRQRETKEENEGETRESKEGSYIGSSYVAALALVFRHAWAWGMFRLVVGTRSFRSPIPLAGVEDQMVSLTVRNCVNPVTGSRGPANCW